ncbi:MAG: helix-turn-helix domain-containing protein [Paracoccaceae bacterium]|nr:helix-turn-helix domain-containing protein [Paracoccaceae bacterium]
MASENGDFIHGADGLAEYLGVSTRRSFYLLESGQIPAAKIGRRWVTRASAIDDYINAQLQKDGGQSA